MHRNLKSFHFKTLVSLLTLVGMFGITGCQELTHFFPATGSSTTREIISPSTILVPEPQNTQFLDVLGIRADTQLSQCRNLEECNQAHFLKALTTLHSNTKVAGYHFKKIIKSSPHHRGIHLRKSH